MKGLVAFFSRFFSRDRRALERAEAKQAEEAAEEARQLERAGRLLDAAEAALDILEDWEASPQYAMIQKIPDTWDDPLNYYLWLTEAQKEYCQINGVSFDDLREAYSRNCWRNN